MSGSNWHDKVSRRNVLRTIGATGVAATAGIGAAKGAPTREIVTIRSGDKAVKTKKVNEEWLHQTNRADRAMEKVRERIKPRDGRTLTLVTTDGGKIGGRSSHRVKVFTESDSDLRAMGLPSEVEGVPIETGTGFSVTPTCYQDTYDPVKTGAALNLDGDDATYENSWTSGGRMVNSSNEDRMLTVYHAVGSPCNPTDVKGTNIEQWGEDFGKVIEQDSQHDAVVIARGSNSAKSGISGKIVDEPDDYIISGHYTQQGMKDLSSVTQHGINTCRTTADIKGLNGQITCDNGTVIVDDLVATEQVAANHDSGALKFALDRASGQYWFFAAGMQSVNFSTSDGSYSGGSAAYALVNSLTPDFGSFVMN